jgi:ABC-type dipeptide/oligopeptide/nickel transport system permease component
MLLFLLKRMGWMLVTLLTIFTITFLLMRAVPGGPFSAERKVPPLVEKRMEDRFHLNDPIWLQYTTTLTQMLFPPSLEQGYPDFGDPMRLDDITVNEVIAEGFPVSASLGILALSFAIVLGTTSGVISAVRRHSWLDLGFMTMATLGIAVPNFVLASLAVILFVFVIPLFPAAGWGKLSQLFLPAFCLGAPFAGYIARLTRAGMLEVLSLDYIRTAYAKGLSEQKVIVHHALRGAITPVVSYLGPATAAILTGSLVIERIFALPGMGSHFVESAFQRDYTLAMGMVLVYSFLLFVMNTLVDISYVMIDPRVKLK